MSVKKNPPTPPTTTATNAADPSILNQFGPMPQGNTTTNAPPEPTAIGAAKWDTVGGEYVFVGTNGERLIKGKDDKYYAIDGSGAVISDRNGNPVTGTPVGDKAGNPIRSHAGYRVPGDLGTEKPGLTSRIEPGSVAATGNAQVTGQPGAIGPARYDEGSETAIFANLPLEQRVGVEQAMLDKGLAPANEAASGAYSPAWVNAFKGVLAFANNRNQTWEDALADMPTVERTGQVKPADHAYSLSSPEDLAAIYKKAISNLIGGGAVPQSEIDKFVRTYQQIERDDKLKAFAAQDAAAQRAPVNVVLGPDGQPVAPQPGDRGTPGTDIGGGALPDAAPQAGNAGLSAFPAPTITESVAPPSPEQVAADEIKQRYAGRYQATNMANAYNLFINSMSSLGSGGAPSTKGA